jgi:methylmalonyl-CoA mutase
MGFDVVLGPLFQTPDEAAREATEKQVDIVSMSSLAAGHLTLMPALNKSLAELGHSELPIVVGGVIPPQDYAELRSYGVRGIFGPGTVLPAAAQELLDILLGPAS